MTETQMFARVLQLRADGLSFRAIEGKMLKAFGMKAVQSGTRAFNLLKRAKAAQAAEKRAAKSATAKPAAGKPAAKPVAAKPAAAVKPAAVAKKTNGAAAVKVA